MSHETNNGSNPEKAQSIVSFKSSFWLAVIIVGLFIAALNFVQVEGKGEEGKGAKTEASEMKSEKTAADGDASAKEVAKPAAEAVKADSAKPGAMPTPTTAPATEGAHK